MSWWGRKSRMILVAMLLMAAVATVVVIRSWPEKAPEMHVDGVDISLPTPTVTGGMSLREALTRRRSVREVTEGALSAQEVSDLCWAAQGITQAATGHRTAPSAGGLYPITVFLVDQRGVYAYSPERHALRQVVSGDIRAALQTAALDQRCVGAAPASFVIAIDVARTASRYGSRAERYCLLEAGHVAQNILLQATALNLGGVPVGAFDDRDIARLLRLPDNLSPAYVIPVGRPHTP
ncbi:MAG: SagB/ThcOx family dehydrogenase [Gemmataceae bacterium]